MCGSIRIAVRSSFAPILEGALLAASVFTISWFTLLQGMVDRADAGSFEGADLLDHPVGRAEQVAAAVVLEARGFGQIRLVNQDSAEVLRSLEKG